MALGFNVSIHRQNEGRSTPAEFETETGRSLIRWETGLGGLNWLDDLVSRGLATELSSFGYPTRYTAPAVVVLPRLTDRSIYEYKGWHLSDESVTGPGYIATIDADIDRINECEPEEWLVIDAWDQS